MAKEEEWEKKHRNETVVNRKASEYMYEWKSLLCYFRTMWLWTYYLSKLQFFNWAVITLKILDLNASHYLYHHPLCHSLYSADCKIDFLRFWFPRNIILSLSRNLPAGTGFLWRREVARILSLLLALDLFLWFSSFPFHPGREAQR